MTLTDIRDQLVLLKQHILAQATQYPAAADQLNIALAHLNDTANIVGVLAMQLDNQRATASDTEREALDRIAELETRLANLQGAGNAPSEESILAAAGATDAKRTTTEDGKPLDPDITTEDLDQAPGHDIFAGEGVDPDATLELGPGEAVAAEAANKAAEQKHRSDPDQGSVNW